MKILNFHYNPISFKISCIQRLMNSIPHTNPMSLFKTCVDVLSWNLDQYFPCTMELPWSLNTGTHVLELQRFKYQPLPNLNLSDVILYDHVCVHPLIKDLWLKQVNTWKYSVPLLKLTAAEITAWQKPTNANSWENIDPYSSLEDIGTTSSDNETHLNSDSYQETKITENENIRDRLWKRHPSHPSIGRPVRKASKNVSCLDTTLNKDIPPSPRKHVHKRTSLSEPSKERIGAKGKK